MALPISIFAPLFTGLDFVDDAIPRPGAMNMAIDEILLESCRSPLLRVYRWNRPSVSFGYFGKIETVCANYSGFDLVRRWTGGGTVPHGHDFTFSLIVPRSERFATLRARDSYRDIHRAVAQALNDFGVDAARQTASGQNDSGSCFESPVADDLMLGGEKIVGGAQRRTTRGLLHQGSIQSLQLEPVFREQLARHFALNVATRTLSRAEEIAAKALAERKYGTPEWLGKF